MANHQEILLTSGSITNFYVSHASLQSFLNILLFKKKVKQEERCIYLSLIVNLLNEEKKSKRNLPRYCVA